MLFLLSDNTIIYHTFPDRRDIHIYPIGDVHLGVREHMSKEWKAFLKQILDDPVGYVVILGDLIDNITRSSIGDIWECVLSPREQKERMVEQLRPLAEDNRILCILPGNHERRSVRETEYNPAYDIALALGVEEVYRENMAFLCLRFGNKGSNGLKNPTYTMVVAHGAGGGKKYGSSLNNVIDLGYLIEGVDIVVTGHTHKPMTAVSEKLKMDCNNGKVTYKPFRVVVSTSWLAWGGYAVRKLLPPAGHAPQMISLKGKKKEFTVTM